MSLPLHSVLQDDRVCYDRVSLRCTRVSLTDGRKGEWTTGFEAVEKAGNKEGRRCCLELIKLFFLNRGKYPCNPAFPPSAMAMLGHRYLSQMDTRPSFSSATAIMGQRVGHLQFCLILSDLDLSIEEP